MITTFGFITKWYELNVKLYGVWEFVGFQMIMVIYLALKFVSQNVNGWRHIPTCFELQPMNKEVCDLLLMIISLFWNDYFVLIDLRLEW
jgi:hypothetical protein